MKHRSNLNLIFNVLLLIFVILFLISYIRFCFNAGSVTFEGLLQFLNSCPQVDFNLALTAFTINGDWGLFEFLRNFFNIFGILIGFIVFLVGNLFNLFTFVFWFIKFIFV